MFRKIGRNIHYDLGITYDMNPRSTGNYHGHTGRNEHGDPHLHAITIKGEYKVYIITGEIKSINGSPSPNTGLRQDILDFIVPHRNELLEMWETQRFYLIKNRKKHRKRK